MEYCYFLAPEALGVPAWKVIAIAVFMLVWWVTEAVPIPVAALLPLVLLPLLGVMDMKTAAAPYANPIVFLFMGGFMVALAMERESSSSDCFKYRKTHRDKCKRNHTWFYVGYCASEYVDQQYSNNSHDASYCNFSNKSFD